MGPIEIVAPAASQTVDFSTELAERSETRNLPAAAEVLRKLSRT
jgi:hypothetical protein